MRHGLVCIRSWLQIQFLFRFPDARALNAQCHIYIYIYNILLTEFISQIFQKTNNFDENHAIINKNIKIINLEILKVKTWFGDKDLFS